MSLSNRDDDTGVAAIRAQIDAIAARPRPEGVTLADVLSEEFPRDSVYLAFHEDSGEYGPGDSVYAYTTGATPSRKAAPKRQIGPRRPRIGRRRLGVALGVVTLCLLTWAFLLAWGGGSSAALWLVLGGLMVCAVTGMYLGPKEGE